MNTKLIIAAAALAVSMGSASTFANASTPEPGYKALGRVKPTMALGRVKIAPEPAACIRARDAIKSNLPKATLLVKICLAQGGNVDARPVELPPVVIGQPAPPASQPSGPVIDASVDPGDYENSNNDGISCDEGRGIVRHSGFRKVRAMDCSSDVFTYSAKKYDQPVKVFVNMDGNIVHVSNLSY